MGTAYITCSCGASVPYDTDKSRRPKYCGKCSRRRMNLMLAVDVPVEDQIKELYAPVPALPKTVQVKL